MSGGGGRRARIEREEFARGHRAAGEKPVAARPAATTIVARPAAAKGFEVLLLERPAASRFAAGAFVFPGGVLDEADRSIRWGDRLPCLPNLPREDRPACVAALRELFEETGLLPADRPVGDLSGLAAARAELLADAVTFDLVADRLGLTFREAPLSYVARWVTPRDLKRRYDTLFFLLALTGRGQAVTITDEHSSAIWATPDEALTGMTEDRLPMLFPTWRTLERLTGFDRLDDAVAALGRTPVTPIEPILDVRGQTVVPRMPGDEGL